MRVRFTPTNMLALPLAIAYSPPLEGETGYEFAFIIGPLYISFQWGFKDGDDAAW